jgi:hypothetical protein
MTPQSTRRIIQNGAPTSGFWRRFVILRASASGDVLEFGAGDLALDATGGEQIFSEAPVHLAPELAAAVTEGKEHE